MEVFKLRPTSGFLKRNWDGECVVFTTDARETHLLTPPCAHILEALERGPASFDFLRCELQDLMDTPDDIEVAGLLREVLDSLDKIGLILALEEVS